MSRSRQMLRQSGLVNGELEGHAVRSHMVWNPLSL